MSSKGKIISVGNLNVDFIGKLEKLPRTDEKVLLNEFNQGPGGGAANFAVACSKLGMESRLIGCVGDDNLGRDILEDLKRSRVEISSVRKVQAPTGVAIILLTSENKRLLIENRGANSYLEPSNLKEDYLDEASLVHASSVTPEIATAIGEKTRGFDIRTSLDFGAELSKLSKKELLKILRNFDICFMNGETFENIFEKKADEENVGENLPDGLEILAVTLGPEGAIVSSGEKTISSPSYEVEVKDTTGGGDTFAAVFDKFILDGSGLEESLKYATAGGALQVQKLGGREGLPTLEQLTEFVESNFVKPY